MKTYRTLLRLGCFLPIVLLACGGSTTTLTVRPGYNFDYHYHQGKPGGKFTIAIEAAPTTLNFNFGSYPQDAEVANALWEGCVIALPTASLGEDGYRADQCREVPTVANGGESADGKHTTLHIDPRAIWSDGQPITADDFLFTYNLNHDPDIYGLYPYNVIAAAKKIDPLTFQIDWSIPFAPYLSYLWGPLPLHIYNEGEYAGLYDRVTGAYDPAIAQRLLGDDRFKIAIPVVNGPFTIKNVDINQAIVLQRNPRFFSNYFTHGVALEQVTFQIVTDNDVRLQGFRDGQYDHAVGFTLKDLTKIRQIALSDLVFSSSTIFAHFDFNERSVAPNAGGNGGASIFADQRVRQAFVQSLDRCAAFQTILNISDCQNPEIASSEMTNIPEFQRDPAIAMPRFDPQSAARLLEAAGYHLVQGQRMARDGKTPLTVTIVHPGSGKVDNGIFANYAAFAQLQWHQSLGIAVQVKGIKLDRFFTDLNDGGTLATGAYDISLYFSAVGADPDGLTLSFQSDQIPSPAAIAGGNTIGLHDAQVDQWLLDGRSALSTTERRAIYKKLDTHLVNQCVALPLYTQANITLAKPTIGNYQLSHINLSTWNIADWYHT